jgi:hypothetical protein
MKDTFLKKERRLIQIGYRLIVAKAGDPLRMPIELSNDYSFEG